MFPAMMYVLHLEKRKMQKIKILTLQLKNRPESDITIELLGPYIITIIFLILSKK